MFLNGDVLVQKFGGSSMASVDRIRRVAQRVADKASRGHRVVVVVSAMGDTTDDLIGLMEKVSIDPNRRELDQMMATGEMVSSALAAATLQSMGVRARSFNAFNLHLLSGLENGEYNIQQIGRLNNLARFLEPGSVAVVAGFQGITGEGDLTTLGRGGSDLTAVVLARELGQKVCEKYTDEDGVYTADPRHVPQARKVWHLNYDEMKTLALYGNGILHPRAICCAKESEIRIHVRSSFTKAEGSVIGPTGDSSVPVKSIAVQSKNVISRIEGVRKLHPVFWSELDSSGIKVLLREWKEYNQNQGSLRLGFSRDEAFSAIPFCWDQAVKLEADEVENFSNVNTISIVGDGIATNLNLVKKFLKKLNEEKIFPIIVDHHGIRLSLSVENPDSNRALKALHDLISFE